MYIWELLQTLSGGKLMGTQNETGLTMLKKVMQKDDCMPFHSVFPRISSTSPPKNYLVLRLGFSKLLL